MQLEEMSSFFAARVDGYDEHMRTEIEGAGEFYPFTASLFSGKGLTDILDLGCGTGLEIEEIFRVNPVAKITGIDLSAEMLAALKAKFPEKDGQLTLIQGDYFTVPFGKERFDAAVSVESLHHFTHEEKRFLYGKLWESLRPGGFYVETDYMAPDQEYEDFYFAEYRRLKEEQGLGEGFFHYDTPCTVENQQKLLLQSGFTEVSCLRQWENTYTICARK